MDKFVPPSPLSKVGLLIFFLCSPLWRVAVLFSPIFKGGYPSFSKYSIFAPNFRNASTNTPIGRCFMRSDIDVLVVDHWMFVKEDQPVVEDDKKWMQEFELD